MPYYYNDDVINPDGIDFVDVDKLVNPPDASNAGKVIGIGEDGKAALIEVGGGLPEVTSEDNGDVLTVVNGEWAKAEPGGEDVELYIVDAPTTDPDAPSDWVKSAFIGGGLSLTADGAALTFADVKRLIDSKSRVKIQNRGVWCFPIGEQLIHIEEDTLTAKFVISDSNGEWLQLGVELFAPET